MTPNPCLGPINKAPFYGVRVYPGDIGTKGGLKTDAKARVLKESGRILLIDFEPGPAEFYQGWTSRVIIFISELLAGREHFRNFRQFMAIGGLSSLITEHNLVIEKQKIVAGGTFNVMLVRAE